MRFSSDKPIFVQIADGLMRDVVAGRLAPEARLASARDLATTLEVNPNTAVRALQILADSGIARSERGTGYFVATDGAQKAREALRHQFFETELPAVFLTMDQLGITLGEVQQHYGEKNHEEK
jgi:DNA-binding transcriptional regulator YhcF (GntR family)